MPEKLENFSISNSVQPKSTLLNKIGLVGCGSMGQDIALLVSGNDIEVNFVEISDERIKEVTSELNLKLDNIINRWGLTQSEKRAVLSRIKGSTNYNILKKCSIVIECVRTAEYKYVLEQKKEIFRKIEKNVSEKTVIASNAATIVISELAQVLEHPERAVGIHFLNPAQTVKIIEVEKSLRTSEEAFNQVMKFARSINKKVILVNESPGNISTRTIIPLINEACEIYMEGVASIEDIDETMRAGYGMQLGPFELADKIGLDKLAVWMENLYTEFGERKYKPSPLIKKLVRANNLGRSTGEGFYRYSEGKKIGVAGFYDE